MMLSNKEKDELHRFAEWLIIPHSYVPDVCIGDVIDWVRQRGLKHKFNIHKEILSWVDRTGNGCPDVEVGYLIDKVQDALSPPLDEDLKEALGTILSRIPGILALKSKSLEELNHTIGWNLYPPYSYLSSTYDDFSPEKEISAALELLSSVNVIACDVNGMWRSK